MKHCLVMLYFHVVSLIEYRVITIALPPIIGGRAIVWFLEIIPLKSDVNFFFGGGGGVTKVRPV